MRINVRDIAAQCAKCGGEDFLNAEGKRQPLASHTTMHCAACGATATYVDLIMQIAQKALARSAATLEDVRRRRGQ